MYLIDKLVLLAERPDGDESAEGVREVREDGCAADALKALELPGSASVEVLEPPVDADHHDGEEDEEGRLDGVDDQRGGADEANQDETLKTSPVTPKLSIMSSVSSNRNAFILKIISHSLSKY